MLVCGLHYTYMHIFGILILSTMYLGAGGMLGVFLFTLFTGNVAELIADRALLTVTIILNSVGGICIRLLWRQIRRERAISPWDSRLRALPLLFRGLPVTDRIAFLTFTAVWVIGFLFGLVFPIFDPTYRR